MGLKLLEQDMKRPLDLMVQKGEIDSYELSAESTDEMRLLGEARVTLSDKLHKQGASVIELYDGELLVGKAEVKDNLAEVKNNSEKVHDNKEFQRLTPIIARGGSKEYGVSGFTPGNPIYLRIKTADGVLLTGFTDKQATFGAGA